MFRRSGRRVHRRKRLAHVRPNHRAETHRSGHRIRHSAGSDRSGGTECRIEFYLDRDLYGITCEAVAKYGDFTFQLVPTAKRTARRDQPRFTFKSLAGQTRPVTRIVRRAGGTPAVPTWSSIDVARVKEEDEQAILLMLTDGVQILKSVGHGSSPRRHSMA